MLHSPNTPILWLEHLLVNGWIVGFAVVGTATIMATRKLSTLPSYIHIFDREHVETAVTVTAVTFFAAGVGFAKWML